MRFHWTLPPLIAALLLSACHRQEQAAFEEVRPVKTIVAGQSEGSIGVGYSGEIVARHESQLGFRTSGKVSARLVDVGSIVKRGKPLMRLSPEQEALQLSAANADVDAAQSRVTQAHIDLQRTDQLLKQQFASRAELDQQRLALEQAEAQLRAATARRDAVVNQQGYTVLTSDRDGVVTAVSAEVGQVVAAGQPVVTVAADGEREVAISIPESRIEELRLARSLRVSVWAHPGNSWEGSLRELAPATDNITRTYSARIAVRNPDTKLLRLGMTASVLLVDAEEGRSIYLPLTAIVDRAGQRQVWLVDPQTSQVALRTVTLGTVQDDRVQVLAGLSGGETVVSAGVHMLQSGQRVKQAASDIVHTAAAPAKARAVQ